MQLVAVCSNKGGVGKTTLCLGLASVLSRNHRTCLLETDLVGAGLEVPPPLELAERRAHLHQYILPLPNQRISAKDLLWDVSLDGSQFSLVPTWVGSAGKLMPGEAHPKHGTLALVRNCAPWVQERLGNLLDELRELGFSRVVLDTHPGIVHFTQVVIELVAQRRGSVVFVASEESRASLAGLIPDMAHYFSNPYGPPKRSAIVIQKSEGRWGEVCHVGDILQLVRKWTGWPKSVIAPPLEQVSGVESMPYNDTVRGYAGAAEVGLLGLDLFEKLGIRRVARMLGLESSKS